MPDTGDVAGSCDLLEATGELKDAPDSLDDIQPSPAFVLQPEVTPTPPASPNPTKSSHKVSKPGPTPTNPLEAAMFKQLFPEEPKVAVKKSMAEMLAEGGSKGPGVSPTMSPRRESGTETDAGLYKILLTESNCIGLADILLVLTPYFQISLNYYFNKELCRVVTFNLLYISSFYLKKHWLGYIFVTKVNCSLAELPSQ